MEWRGPNTIIKFADKQRIFLPSPTQFACLIYGLTKMDASLKMLCGVYRFSMSTIYCFGTSKNHDYITCYISLSKQAINKKPGFVFFCQALCYLIGSSMDIFHLFPSTLAS